MSTPTTSSTSTQSSRLSRKLDEWINISKTGIVLYPFNATHKFQLPLSVGDFVHIHAQTSNEQTGWYSGASVTTQESGIFPQSYVVILPDQANVDDQSTLPNHIPICSKLSLSNEEMSNSSLVNEITMTIVEWATLLKTYSQNKQYNDFKILSNRITTLVQFRNQLLAFSSPKEITFEFRDKILNVIDDGRRETGMTIVLRKEISNSYSSTQSSSLSSTPTGGRGSVILLPTVATDLILADAENTGVFTLCTMYQEQKMLESQRQEYSKSRDSTNYNNDLNILNNDLETSSTGSGSNININNSSNSNSNNNSTSNGNTPSSINSGGVSPMSNVTLSSNQNSPASGSSSPNQSQSSSPSSSNININSPQTNGNNSLASMSSKDINQFSSSPGGSSFLVNNSNNSNSTSSSPSQGKLSKLPSSMNFLSSVRLKNKQPSSLSMSGGMQQPPLTPTSSGSSSNLNSNLSNVQNNSNNNSSNSNSNSSNGSLNSPSSSMVSQSYIAVSQSPSGNGNGSNLNLSSLNLNSPMILSNSSSGSGIKNKQAPLKKGTAGSTSSRSFLNHSSPSIGGANGAGSGAYGTDQVAVRQMSQILVSLNNFLYSSGEFIDIVLSIYNKNENKFISEPYCGVVPREGIFVEPENPQERIRTIFRDLDSKDMNSELYLVVKLYRKTNSVSSKDPNSSPTLTKSNVGGPGLTQQSLQQQLSANSKLFRKYVGCGVKKLDLSNEGLSEVLITLYTTTNENGFSNLHESLINEQSSLYEPITRAKGVVFSFQLFHGDYQQFISEHTDYRSITTCLKVHLPEVILPGSERNDMYIQLEEGDFSDKNIEVTMQIKTETGLLLHDAIKWANGAPEQSEFKTPLISSTLCKWSEIVKVWMAAKTFEKAHILFLVRQCSEKKDKERTLVAFGYLKFLSDDGAVIKDGSHTVVLHKLGSGSEEIPVSSYINGVVDPSQSGKSSSKKQDTIKVRTSFVSTCLTQNPLVVNLSRWQSFPGDLSSLIKDITFLGQHDLIRNLQEIFYNFLAILDQQLNDSPLSMEIFRSFVFIIGVLVDSRTTNYRPALDLYVGKYFGVPLSSSGSGNNHVGISAHTHLLRSVVKNLENFQDAANASRISSSLKALEYIFKMVVASKTKFTNKETVGNESYQTNLKNVVDILCEIMVSNAGSLIGAQTIALKNFESMFSDLKRFFTVEEMGIIALKFMKSIQHLEKNKTFNLLKLKLLSSFINGPMMLNKDMRKQLHPIVFQLLQFHFGKSIEETDMCLTILGLIVDIMITKSELRGKDKDPWLMEMLTFFVPILELLLLINSNNTNNNNSTSMINVNSINNGSPLVNNVINQAKRRSSSSVSLNGASTSISLASMVSSMTEDNINDLRIKIYAFILGSSRLSGVQHWEMINKSVTPTNKTFFLDLYESLQLLFETPKFPSDFWTFTVFQLKTILRMTRILEDVIFYQPTLVGSNDSNGGSANTGGGVSQQQQQQLQQTGGKSSLPQFEFELWKSFFLMTSSYLNCKDLQLESVNPAKAVFLKNRCGDVRIEMARVFERVWSAVPVKERSSFIPHLIHQIIKLSISDTLDAKRVATKIFYDMLESEIIQTEAYSELFYRTIESLLEIGAERSIDKTWPLVTRSHGVGLEGKFPFTLRSFSTFFNPQCMSLVLNKSTDQIKKKSEVFIQEINHFLTLITTFMGDIKNRDEEEIFASTTKLLLYLQEHKRFTHFVRFVHMCSKRHYSNGNYIEAAVTLMLHASLYQWDHNKVVNSIQNEFVSFPEQKESERKEILYKEILACYNKGKAWDRAIPLLKELIHHFTMNICDMNSAATYLRQQGTFYQKINESSDPIFEEYFRVGYYGKKFPLSIQNKEFIYKGNEFERLSDFIQKTLERWPKAELLKATDIPAKTIQDADAQYLLITSVNVSNINEIQKRSSVANAAASADSFSNKKRVPHRVQQFNARNRVNVFLYSKPFKKNTNANTPKSQNEFEDLWIMNLYFVCENSFPCTERRSCIVERKQVELSPIENALNSIVQKNDELQSRIDKYQANPQETIHPLTMLLNGIIDASVNGGVSRYDQFLSNEYLKQYPEYKNFAELLKSAMDQQLVVVEQGLKLHATLRPPEMAAMQDKLENFFNQMKIARQKLN
ncbi:hypothetical protein CYY_001343 [Polysphondylium violaceum]|uniref:SH3 domain-containing protein n=1 Tax=Polysphondylium violaceum TaxID=133409 RepID=A0A8J4V1P9_9MYCE|nr:hypothetical protein CYY_001343 [Polysphondylium violaceum]